MKILDRKNQAMLLNIIAANQIIMNAYNNLNTMEQIEAFSQFCNNSAEAIYILGGIKALEEAKEIVFISDDNINRKKDK